jgi:hypothetical protein
MKMNYQVKAFKISSNNGDTQLEVYEKSCPNYTEAEKEVIRLRSTGEYTHIHIYKLSKEGNMDICTRM